MIAEKDSLKEIKLKELETVLLKQHFPERIIKAGINKDLKIPQIELRNVKKQEEKKILPFISTFNPNNPEALLISKQILENLKTSGFNFGNEKLRQKSCLLQIRQGRYRTYF